MTQSSLEDLLYLISRLRDPETGCPWDLEQDFTTVAPYTLEETFEVLDAIASEDFENLREELGDLLFQVVFLARMADEAGLFDFNQVVAGLVEKMVRRHPHVFPDGTLASRKSPDDDTTTDQVIENWQTIKQKERLTKGEKTSESAMPSKLPAALPSLTRAFKLQKAAAKVGFDWSDAEPVFDKIQEEIEEIREVVRERQGNDRIAEEIGDLMFACVNLARHLSVDADMSVRKACDKFENRFRSMEFRAAEEGREFQELTLDEMEAYWQLGKVL
ncbi:MULTISPECIES: nucleoside triphosphate pyrophosphohydrolase [unclassified Endozoicomonas]|uniref:nucleoside triphosphate pyrophosphohydrolase n=1 Tax=unclassified Endozoicomonas TaxID=2644528 RepID=UPI002147AF41|nr:MULTISPECIES: nucleoside triphosphate pyrophosphohydrolase [unclassified Endozoicomonas]